MSSPDKPSRGKLQRVGQWIPPVHVDASGWARAPGPRARGKLVSVAQHLPTVEAKFVRAAAVWFEVVLAVETATDPAAGRELVGSLLETAREAAPALGLTHDPSRSRSDAEGLVIALRPEHPDGAENHLGELIRRVRLAVAATPRPVGLVRAGLRWAS